MTAPPTAVQISEVTSGLAGVCERVGHSEIYGIDLLAPDNADPVKLLAGKYLRAHGLDTTAALVALEATLAWRKSFDPRSAAFVEVHDPKFDGLGYITLLGDGVDRDVVTWNIYGAAAKDPKAVFEPLDAFLRWRVGLMERSVDLLQLGDYTGDGVIDTKQAIQVHDYLSVSFLRMHPSVKAGSRAIIDLMTKHYPESMRRKFFVNVPAVMGWMFSAMRLFLSKETVQKFTILGYGQYLAGELGHADRLPKEYGGAGNASLRGMAEPWNVTKAEVSA